MVGAFQDKHGGCDVLERPAPLQRTRTSTRTGASIEISLVTALARRHRRHCSSPTRRSGTGTPRWVRSVLTTFSGVAANFGGIPLAFAFIATLGPLGIVTTCFLTRRYDLRAPRLARDFQLFSRARRRARLPLLPDPADDPRDRARDRRAASPSGARPPSNLGAKRVAVLALRRAAGADAVDPRRGDPALRQRVRRLRDGVRAQPGS